MDLRRLRAGRGHGPAAAAAAAAAAASPGQAAHNKDQDYLQVRGP